LKEVKRNVENIKNTERKKGKMQERKGENKD